MDCLKCKHFYTTWDKNFPRGCRFFEIKTKYNPSLEIKKAIGKDCPKYETKEGLK